MQTILILLLLFLLSRIVFRTGRGGREMPPRPGGPFPRPPSEEVDSPVPGPWSTTGDAPAGQGRPAPGYRSRGAGDLPADDHPLDGPWNRPQPPPERPRAPSRSPAAGTAGEEKPDAVRYRRKREKKDAAGTAEGMAGERVNGGRAGEEALPVDCASPRARAQMPAAAAGAAVNGPVCPDAAPEVCGELQKMLSPGGLAAAVVLAELIGPRGGRRAGRG